MTESSVDFPAPDGPMTATRAAAGMVKSAVRRKSSWVMIRRSSSSIGTAPPVEKPEGGEAEAEEQNRRAGGVGHPVGAHQPVELQRQRCPVGIGVKRDDAEIAHRERRRQSGREAQGPAQ